ncbi:MAG: RNA polymerase factor sigma-54 [Polyangiales bacterium]
MEIKLLQGLHQKLVMTPQLQMAIRLLQLSRLELIDAVREEMLGNPILDEGGDSPEVERAHAEAETPTVDRVAALDEQRDKLPSTMEERNAISETAQQDYWEKFLDAYANQTPLPTQGRLSDEDLPSLEATLTGRTKLTDHLEDQIRLSTLTDTERRFALLVIHNLDENGYLNLRAAGKDAVPVMPEEEPEEEVAEGEGFEGEGVEARAEAETEAPAAELSPEAAEQARRALTIEDLARESGMDPEDAEIVLGMIQAMDPVGVAARDLRECLLVQLEFLGYDDDDIVWQVVDHHLPNLERRNFGAISRDLRCELQDVYDAAKLISTLEPRPGRNFTTEEPAYITPDVYVHKVGDDYVVSTNDDGMPKLKINEQQARALMKDPKAREFIQGKLASAKWFVRSLDQRQKTIVKVTQAIVEKQRDFFEKGINHLRPMILRDVADAVGMHESTISRVTTNKYVHTPRGIFELKYFFNSSIRRVAQEDIASESVKQAIKKIIAEEDPKNPFSDEQIVKQLAGQKIIIARRTVAKYREMLGILSSAKRKQYY